MMFIRMNRSWVERSVGKSVLDRVNEEVLEENLKPRL